MYNKAKDYYKAWFVLGLCWEKEVRSSPGKSPAFETSSKILVRPVTESSYTGCTKTINGRTYYYS